MVKSGFHDSPDAQSVDIPHGEIVDTQAFQVVATKKTFQGLLSAHSRQDAEKKMRIHLHSLFSGVNVSQADVDQIPRRQDRFHPGESWNIRHLWQDNDAVKDHPSQNSFKTFRRPSPCAAAPSAGRTRAGRGGSPMASSLACSGLREHQPR